MVALCLLGVGLMRGADAVTTPDPLPEGAVETGSFEDPPGRYGVAAAVWTGLDVPFLEMNGTRTRTAWQLPNSPGALQDLVNHVEEVWERDDFELVLSCTEASCGGFDFRHRLDVLPLPEMYVDLGVFRYISLARYLEGTPVELVALLASTSGGTVHVQIDQVSPLPQTDPPAALPPATSVGEPQNDERPASQAIAEDIAASFAETGEFVLEDLVFATGASDLSDSSDTSLAALANYLVENPEDRIVLVGHTDATGSLEGNAAVSRRRAQAVADRLVASHGVSASRLIVQGAGVLAPRASNTTEEGRNRNRRVTAVLLPQF